MKKTLFLLLFSTYLFAQTPGGVPLTDMSLWISGDTNVTDSGTLTWGDRSGGSNDVYQATADNKAAQSNLFNFNQTFTFDGNSDFFAVSNLNYTVGTSLDNIHAFVVYKTSYSGGVTSNWAFLDFDRSNVFNLYISGEGGLAMSFADTTAPGNISDNYAPSPGNDNEPHLGTFIYNKDIALNTKMRLDGHEDYASTNINTGITARSATRFGYVGEGSESESENGEGPGEVGSTRNNIYYDGDIAEIIYFDDLSLTTAEKEIAISKIESYLALKYGITLSNVGGGTIGDYVDSGNTVIWDASDTENMLYHHNIAGLINDNAVGEGVLDQKVAGSKGASMVVSTTNNYTLANNDVSRTSLTNGDYFLFGDNGAASGLDPFIGADFILKKKWLVRKNNDSGDLFIAINKNEFANGATVELITSVDDVFDGSDPTLTADGTTGDYIYWEVNLADGDRFSFIAPDVQIAGVSVTRFDMILRADKDLTVGATLNWTDASPQGTNGAQPSGSSVPSLTEFMNFNPTLTFDGDSDYIALENKKYEGNDVVRDLHAFVVYSTEYNTIDESPDFDNWSFLDFDRSEAYNMFIRPDGKLAFSYQSAGTKDLFSASLGNDGLPHIAEFVFNGDLTNETFMKFDGNVEFNSDLTDGNIVVRNAGNVPRFGFVGDGSEASSFNGTRNNIYFDGKMSELILADRESFSATETIQLESYLGLKYGVTIHQSVANYLDSSGSILWDDTTYWSGIAGLIKDDENSDLDQRVAQSTSAEDIILSKELNFTAANTDHATRTTSLVEGTSLLFGNNGASKGFVNYDTGRYLTTRRWMFRENGADVGSVYIAIPKSFFPDATTNVEMLLSSDDVFTTGDTEIDIIEGTGIHSDFYYIDRNFVTGDRIAFIVDLPTLPSPAAVNTGLSMWIKGDKNVTSSIGILTSIGDSGTEGNGVSQATNIDKPSNSDLFSYNPAIGFDGDSDHLAVENLNFTTAGEIDKMYAWIVYESDFSATPTTAPDTSNRSLLSFDGNEYFDLSLGGDGKLGYSYTTSTGTFNNVSAATGTNDGAAKIGGFVFDTALGANETQIRLNGLVDFSGNVDNNPIGSGAVTRFGYVGDGSSATAFDGGSTGDYYNGKIAEIIYYQGATIVEDDMKKIESYLGLKYGVTLDNTGGGVNGDYIIENGASPDIVIWDASANSDYHDRIAVIGRYDASELKQKQSISSGLNGVLTVSLAGTIAETNADVDPMVDFDDDLDFLAWGSKSTGTLFKVECGLPVLKVNRDWKVQNTGNVGAVTLQFDMTDVAIPEDFDLIIDEDGDGDFGTGTTELITSGAISGVNLTFTGVALEDGEVITLKRKSGYEVVYNGAWSGGSGVGGIPTTSAADEGKRVTVEADVTLTESFNCDCLKLDPDVDVTVPTTMYVSADEIVSDGSVYLEGDAELIQDFPGANINSGTGIVYKILDDASSSIYAYNFFSSPVNTAGSFTLVGNLKFNTGATLDVNTDPSFTRSNDGATNTISTRWTHTMNNDVSFTEVNENHAIVPGVGFTMKGTGEANKYNFIGIPNNGDVTVPVTSGNYLLAGNPYPSTIDANVFNTDNTTVTDGVVYLWDQPNATEHYDGDDDHSGGYATIANGVTVAKATFEDGTTEVPDATLPTPYIRPGQGFVVYGENTGDVKFTNAQRKDVTFDTGRHFFKTKKIKTLRPIIRLGFEYETSSGKKYHRQLVTVLDGGSLEKETGKDAYMFDYFENDAYWLLPNYQDRFVLTSVPDPESVEELPIGIVLNQNRQVSFKIDGTQGYSGDVYLLDKELATITDIKSGTHNLFLEEGEYKDRFSLVFEGQNTLDYRVIDPTENVLVYSASGKIHISLNEGSLKGVQVYSLTGSQVYNNKFYQKQTELVIDSAELTSQIYVLKIITDNTSITKKIMVR